MALPIAVVGLGARGRQWIRALRTAPGYELVACVDVNPEVARQAAAELRLAPDQCYGCLDDALGAGSPRGVIVATSIDRHVGPCETALTRGLGVLVEKPFALSVREAGRLVALARDAGVPIVVGQSYRYARTTQTVRRLVQSGVLGRIGMVTCQAYRDPSDLPASLTAVPNSLLWETGVHYVDALRYILGQEVVSVMAQSFTAPWSKFRQRGGAQALLTFADGPRASFCGTYDSYGHEFFNRGQEFYLRVSGERGTLHVFMHWILLWERGRYPRLLRRGPRPNPEAADLLPQLQRALLTGEEPECSGRDNLRTVAAIEACARSAAEGRSVSPQELLDGAC